MPVVAAVGTVILTAFLLWFAIGTQRNITRGNNLLQWLQRGLPLLGKRTTLRWLGSSAVQLELTDVREPYIAAQVNLVLEPRDIGWWWAWARRRGRRDFLIFRGTLSGPPRFEMEVGGQRGWTGSDRLDRLDPGAWEQEEWDDDEVGSVEVAHSGRADGDDVDAVRELWHQLGAAGRRMWRLSIRNQAPQVEVHVEPSSGTATAEDAQTLIEAFRDLGRLASR
jgi:hypothetical protein